MIDDVPKADDCCAAETITVKAKAVILLLTVGALLGGVLLFMKHRSSPSVAVMVRITVAPAEQVTFVTARANSAQFKYLVGKQCGIKPAIAQKLALKAVPNSALVEARLGKLTQDEGRRYVDAFLPTLQDLCGEQVQLALASQSIQ